MSLAIFDLDNTLIADDSDFLWGQFLVERGIVDKDLYADANKKFYEDYKQGCLNIVEFLNFSLAPLARHDADQLYRWRAEFVEDIIRPIVLEAAQTLVDRHRDAGDVLMVITATNRFVTEPIVRLFGIEHLLATTPEKIDGQYTGKFIGTPSFQQGKVSLLQQWLAGNAYDLKGSHFYSDSHNDLPLLNLVENPVAVDPDDKLRQLAHAANWPIISLR
ncbi:MAG: HAD family hydrolase [Methylomonas sp.]|nr:HAD family hydrolase [Methylomonas sp.]PPD20896.1 MAG: HAD-IB family hydrolase [Methylomonas sp.]PPD25603.1 MAG: HAD-IB family hydrolase [Methylomonas sp.]PPD36604.1 MAG: HAD-IB family hydrolase [Methylomonas sp.]PPD39927.1 MAG: HAD-IB family hydrolase [Methylomonas sp.]